VQYWETNPEWGQTDINKTLLEQLENTQQTITIKSLSSKLGISVGYLYDRPEIITLIGEFNERTRPKAMIQKFQRREEELVQAVKEAIGHLQSTEQRVSVTAIARLLHLSQPALYRYPKVRLILEDIAQKWRHRGTAQS
jgi:hypothetical protein